MILDYLLTGNCTFLGSASYPEIYLTGLGLQKIGNTSLTFKLAMFPPIQECLIPKYTIDLVNK